MSPRPQQFYILKTASNIKIGMTVDFKTSKSVYHCVAIVNARRGTTSKGTAKFIRNMPTCYIFLSLLPENFCVFSAPSNFKLKQYT